MDTVECVVIGAGVVGLACARALAMAGRDVIILEAGPDIGMETSSRNSEVIHSGIYYPMGSLKASACVKGRDALYAYCQTHHINHAKIGKLIVATNLPEQEELTNLLKKGQANGVTDLELIDSKDAIAKEPGLSCLGALWSPSTGIIDSHGLMLAFQGEFEDHGGMIAFNTLFERAEVTDNGIIIKAGTADIMTSQPFTLKTQCLINAAGLNAQDVARNIEGFNRQLIPDRHIARGVYFSLRGNSPFSHLIYPAPEPGGLGVHATLDLAGQCRFGPDVEWIDEIDYNVDPKRGDSFYEKIRKYWPDLKDNSLIPAYAGIRPKVSGPGKPAGDFIIQGPQAHKSGAIINLFGIESPGLTASMALAKDVEVLANQILI